MTTALDSVRPKTGNERGTYIYIGVYSAVLYMVLLIAPVITSKLVEQFGLSATQVGGLLSLELGAFSLATVPAYLWLRRVNLVTATQVFTIIAVLGNIISGLVDSYVLLVICRVITSLAAGSITVIILGLSGKAANPGRAYGLFVAAQLVMGAVILALFPSIFATLNVSAIYWTMAGLAALCIPAAKQINPDALRVSSETKAVASTAQTRQFPLSLAVLGLAAVFFFYVGLSSVWSFMGQIAANANLDLGTTSLILSLATLPGIASSVLATWLGDSPWRRAFLIGGYLAMTASIALLFGLTGALQFALAAVVFKFAWTFVLPYLLTSISDLDSNGQLMNSTNLMIGSGFALGPALGGVLIESSGGFDALLWTACAGVVISMIFAVSIQRRKV